MLIGVMEAARIIVRLAGFGNLRKLPQSEGKKKGSFFGRNTIKSKDDAGIFLIIKEPQMYDFHSESTIYFRSF